MWRIGAKVCSGNLIWQLSLQATFCLLRFYSQLRVFLTATFSAFYSSNYILYSAEDIQLRDVSSHYLANMDFDR